MLDSPINLTPPADSANAASQPTSVRQAPRSQPAPGTRFADSLQAAANNGKPAVDVPATGAAPLNQAGQNSRLPIGQTGETLKMAVAGQPQLPAMAMNPAHSGVPLDFAALRKLGRQLQGAISETPAVALLTGRLEKLNPSEIPALISGNKFVTNAISKAGIPEFMQEPRPLRQLMQELELPQQVTEQIAALGMDLNQSISPYRLFKTLGIDPQRITAELEMLQANLPLEGAKPYIRRAEALQKKHGVDLKNPVDAATTVAPQAIASNKATASHLNKTPGTEAPIAHPNQPSLKLPDLSPSGKSNKASPIRPQLNQMGMPAGLQQTPGNQLEIPSELSNIAQTQRVSTALGTAAENIPAKTQTPAFSQPTAEAPIPEIRTAPLSNPKTNLELKQFAQQHGLTITPPDKSALATSINSPSATLEEQLMRGDGLSRLTTPKTELNTTMSASPLNTMQNTTIKPDVPNPTELPTYQIGKTNKSGTSFAAATQPNTAQVQKITNQVAANIEQISNDPKRDAALLKSRREVDLVLTRPEQDKQGSTRVPVEELTQRITLAEAPSSISQGHSKAQTAVGEAAQVSRSDVSLGERVNVVQQVLDQVATLRAQNGGSLRLGLGSDVFGHVEMAIQLSDDMVSIQMLTGSEKMRDAIVGEMSQLREALVTQQLQLSDVNVSVGDGNSSQSWLGSSSGQSQARHEMLKEQQQAWQDAMDLAQRAPDALAAQALKTNVNLGNKFVSSRNPYGQIAIQA